MTLPKELYVSPVQLDGGIVLDPAVFVCLSLYKCASLSIFVYALKRFTYSHISERSSCVQLNSKEIYPSGRENTNRQRIDFLKILIPFKCSTKTVGELKKT